MKIIISIHEGLNMVTLFCVCLCVFENDCLSEDQFIFGVRTFESVF